MLCYSGCVSSLARSVIASLLLGSTNFPETQKQLVPFTMYNGKEKAEKYDNLKEGITAVSL